MVFSVVVFITLKNEEFVPKMISAFEKLVQSSNNSEPECFTYELHVDNENAKRLIVIERYANKEALEGEHQKSPEFVELIEKFMPENKDEVENVEIITGTDVNTAFTTDDKKASSWTPSGVSSDGVLVFCGARPGAKPEYMEEAAKLGALIAKRNVPLVYGGGTKGVMGAVAQGVLDAKGSLKSVIPRALKPREVSGDMLGTVYYTHTMSERKSLMFDMSSTVIALPGGWGTFDELLESLTLYQLNAYTPKIGLLNVCGFYEPFLVFVKHLISEGFLEEKALEFMVMADTAEELFKKLDAHTRPDASAPLSWTAKP